MQLSASFVTALLAFSAAHAAASPPPSPMFEVQDYKRVNLSKPLNWIAGPSLFPGNVIAGYNADLSEYNAEGWAAYILKQCKAFSACTSTISNQATNSGSTGGRYWFGYVFRGGPTSQKNYAREDGVTDSIAFTISTGDDDDDDITEQVILEI